MSNLKFFSGPGQAKWKKETLNIAATSIVQAAKIASFVCYNDINVIRTSEIRNTFQESWEEKMKDISIPEEPCCYITHENLQKPIILEIPKNI